MNMNCFFLYFFLMKDLPGILHCYHDTIRDQALSTVLFHHLPPVGFSPCAHCPTVIACLAAVAPGVTSLFKAERRKERQHLTVPTRKAFPPCNRPFVLLRENEELKYLFS